jgi:hypothetical protein
MNRRPFPPLVLAATIWPAVALTAPSMAAQRKDRGTITGHVRLLGKLPGNPVIRMRRHPLCAKLTAGKQVVQETVVAALDGSLANVFVKLDCTFPDSPVPSQPVTIDQRGCTYTPRVAGLRLGQTLEVKKQRRSPAQRAQPFGTWQWVQHRSAPGRSGVQGEAERRRAISA